MLTSKSPRDVAIVALAAGKEAFSDYSHIYSPKKFTQPQLFAYWCSRNSRRRTIEASANSWSIARSFKRSSG